MQKSLYEAQQIAQTRHHQAIEIPHLWRIFVQPNSFAFNFYKDSEINIEEFTKVIESFDSEMNRKGLIPKTKVIAFRKDIANEEVSENLEIPEGEEVYKLIRLRYAGEKPTVLVTTYIPFALFKDLATVDFSTQLLYKTFEEKGYPVKTVTRRLDVIQADDTASDLLDIEVGAPLFYFHTRGFSNDKLPVEYSISKYRGDINSFVFEIKEGE